MASSGFRVLTLNCLFHGTVRARLEAIGPLLEQGRFDLVCLQEVALRRHVQLLSSRMPGYRATVQPRLRVGVMGGLVTFTRHAVTRSSYEVFRKRGDWGTTGAVDRLGRKGFLTTWVDTGVQRLVLVNTHLLANYDEDWSPGNRYAVQQEDELRQLGDALEGLGDDVSLVVAGDFNIPAAHPMLDRFRQRTGLRNAQTEPSPTYRSPDPSQPGQQIDHILYRFGAGADATVTTRLRFEAEVPLADGRLHYPSDHFGVEADFEIAR